jgi:dihydropteroate synthase
MVPVVDERSPIVPAREQQAMGSPDSATAGRQGGAAGLLLECGGYRLDFSTRTHIMGILNVTPDSFSDGGRCFDPAHAVEHARRMADEGADVIDIGGESTRPGATPVSLEEERRRVLPVVERLVGLLRIPLSIDTTKAAVADEAIMAGAVIINDVSALRVDPAMAALAARSGAAVVLMHMRGTPRTMQQQVAYDAMIPEICAFLRERIDAARAAGIGERRIMIDPGIGFGKSVPEGNLSLLRHLGCFASLQKPVLVGPSRKAFIGGVVGDGPEDREYGTAAAVAIAVANGASMVRVHKVGMMKRVVAMADAIMAAGC